MEYSEASDIARRGIPYAVRKLASPETSHRGARKIVNSLMCCGKIPDGRLQSAVQAILVARWGTRR